MPRRNSGGSGSKKTPDMGFQWLCDYCQDDAAQGPMPALKWLHEVIRGDHITTPFQACTPCGREIDEVNEEFFKKNPQYKSERQVRPLREGSELPPQVQEAMGARTQAMQDSEDKLDKLINLVGSLAQIMTAQAARALTEREMDKFSDVVKAVVETERQIIPTPKRKILAPPKATRAKSTTKKPKAAADKAAAKPKSRRAKRK